jgi:hypothetical protein
MAYYAIKFQSEILKNSESKIFTDACDEWYAVHYSILSDDDDVEYCICSHEIKQLIQIENKINNNLLIIGCDCARHIQNITNVEIYEGALMNIKELRNKKSSKISSSLIMLLRLQKTLPDKQIDFIENMKRKRKITDKQASYYNDLINKILKIHPNKINQKSGYLEDIKSFFPQETHVKDSITCFFPLKQPLFRKGGEFTVLD